jgi:tripeptide aminopeptidase
VLVDGRWQSAGETILGADNKATVAVLLGLAHRAAVEGTPVGVELVFTVGEENGLQGAKAFDASKLRSESGFVYDHASPIGEIVVASPTFYRLQATFRGQAAHAGVRPEDGRSAILAAARAIAAMRLGRLDDETTANVAIDPRRRGRHEHRPERCPCSPRRARSTTRRPRARLRRWSTSCYDAANDPQCECDLDLASSACSAATATRDRAVGRRAEAALRALRLHADADHSPAAAPTRTRSSPRASSCTNLANGTERNHESDRARQPGALEGMLDVTFACSTSWPHDRPTGASSGSAGARLRRQDHQRPRSTAFRYADGEERSARSPPPGRTSALPLRRRHVYLA